MAQNYTINVYQSDHNALSDMQNVENNLECLRSNFSGTSSPANALAGHPWYDTGASSRNGGDNQNLLKVYNQTRSVWYGVMTGDINQKIPVYRNDQMDGWVIDTSVTDKIIAVKGGSTYTTGGVTAGSWTLPSFALTTSHIPAHTHGAIGNHVHAVRTQRSTDSTIGVSGGTQGAPAAHDIAGAALAAGGHTHTSVGSSNAHSHGATYRPAAAVHTIQYLDI